MQSASPPDVRGIRLTVSSSHSSRHFLSVTHFNVTCLGLLVSLFVALPANAEDRPREQVHQFVADSHFNGVVLVGKGGRAEYVEAFGGMDADAKKPLQRTSRFFVGSVSKWLTSIAVLRLVDEGKLALDEPILTYLPEYRADTGKQLTLRHLISHGSGLPNGLIDAAKKDPSIESETRPQAEAVTRYASGDLAFTPGTRFDYNLSNWILVQAILERVSGQSYAQLVQRLVFKPLRMTDSGIAAGEAGTIPNLALGYRSLEPKVERRVYTLPNYLVTAGGFYSTADDMLRLNHGVLSGKLLSPASRKALLTIERPESAYALGGRVRTFEAKGLAAQTVATNDGTSGAYRTVSWRVLDDGRTVILLSNLRPDDAKLFAFTESLLGLPSGQREN
ncbi:serine hydrolase domain-containing protein [Corallococcus carmarthensis]|uniref:Class A beta-lactamase-related serine hydrolase n=1 Tax=Corallococcus carmarthensis TaxID=2316728 RepID=A0A3A8K8F0_9BACT|nr:serine hydrolase domain-containing protein [Corallococcus carmarthensis]RKH03479.1 class A beta-lactamase-related serine hydrolase [Corallococcus carmarthensis]